jgi:hypothetical protein
MRRIAMDGAHSLPSGRTDTDDGGRGYHVYPPKRRNLQVIESPSNAPVSREVRIIRADGSVSIRTANLGIPGRHRTTVKPPRPTKRSVLAQGAIYGDSWQTSHATPNADWKGIYRKGADPDAD